MAKDPAFLFYSDNFLSGTMFFTDEQVGKYMRLLCAQHQHGHLSEKHMLHICKTYDKDIWDKFTKDESGLFYQPRLETEVEKRKNFTESRRKNRLSPKKQTVKPKKKSNTSKTYDSSYENHMSTHMGNGNGNGNINEMGDEKGKGGAGEKPKTHPEFKTCIEIYDKFILEQTSTHAQIDGGEGKAMNSIISALSKTEKVEDGAKSIPEVWEYILKHRDSWDAFHQTQLKIKQINSNLVNILTVLKNGNPRKQSKNSGASELATLAKAAENGAIIDLDAKYGKGRH